MSEKKVFGVIGCMGICILIVFALPQIGLSIANFVIGAQNQDATCDIYALVTLPTWLFITGALGLFFVFMLVIAFVAIIVITLTNPKLLPFPLVPLIILIIIFSLFNLAWNIVGAVSLFRDSMECFNKTKALWGLTLANLILQWLSIGYTCLGGGSTRVMRDDDD